MIGTRKPAPAPHPAQAWARLESHDCDKPVRLFIGRIERDVRASLPPSDADVFLSAVVVYAVAGLALRLAERIPVERRSDAWKMSADRGAIAATMRAAGNDLSRHARRTLDRIVGEMEGRF